MNAEVLLASWDVLCEGDSFSYSDAVSSEGLLMIC
jgi:hypothetical protein